MKTFPRLLSLALAGLCPVGLLGNSPPVILSNGGGDAAAISFPENGNVVTTVRFSDADGSGIDILTGSGWYENNGTGQFGPRQDPGGTYAADLGSNAVGSKRCGA